MDFVKTINNEEEYLNYIFPNNLKELKVCLENNGSIDYVYYDEDQTYVVIALDYMPPFPCEIALVSIPSEDEQPGVNLRLLKVKPI